MSNQQGCNNCEASKYYFLALFLLLLILAKGGYILTESSVGSENLSNTRSMGLLILLVI
jgi:hypothetical protein